MPINHSKADITVSIVVPSKQSLDHKVPEDPVARLSSDAYDKLYGPDPESLKLVKAFAREYGLTFESPGLAGPCTLYFTGSQNTLEKAFGVTLSPVQVDGNAYRVREGMIYLPEELSGHVLAVLGLDNRPQSQPHLRKISAIDSPTAGQDMHKSNSVSTPTFRTRH